MWPGNPSPLGATPNGEGTNFSLWSRVAERVELCLFDPDGNETRIDLPATTGHRWHGFVPGVGPGQRYGFRVHGPYAPKDGHRCNPAKLLLDPYARAVDGAWTWDPSVFGHAAGSDAPMGVPDARDDRDSAPHVGRGVVVDDRFDWGADAAPRRPLTDTVVYELHVKGFTAANPAVPEHLRGTFAGLAHPASIAHLQSLGITAVELLPVTAWVSEQELVANGLRNYWGYNPISWFAPEPSLAAADDPQAVVEEFKSMVLALHGAGIEVLLDVVYNHTAEAGAHGPTLSWRGIDNAAYYRLARDDRRHYANYSGCGNTVDARVPAVVQLVCDSLRYLVQECHVDGFRFDLASSLGRGEHGFEPWSALLTAIGQDPVLSEVKLIAEPWDVGPGGYQLGGFPAPWSEWNDRFRDTMRDYWRGVDESLPELAARLAGSEDLFGQEPRHPTASVNYVTAHDGFTLRDLVSYDERHNEANGFGNTDGHPDNRSWNCGVEGPTDDEEVLALRSRQQRNLLATLLLSQGVPMLLAGDEIGRTQGGNNNGFCLDDPTTWLDWEKVDQGLLEFTRGMVAFRLRHPVFRRRHWLVGRLSADMEDHDTEWLTADAHSMTDRDWQAGTTRTLQVLLNGRAIKRRGDRGEPLADDTFLLLLNAGPHHSDFVLPGAPGETWGLVLDTADSRPPRLECDDVRASGTTTSLQDRHLLLFTSGRQT